MIKEAQGRPPRTHNNSSASSSGSLSLRATTPEDGALLLEIYASTRLIELELVTWDENQRRAFTKMQFDARQQQYREYYPGADGRIILQRGQSIGTILVDRREREIVLVDIALLPEHRNAGIGTHLVKALLEEAAGAGKTVRLHVLAASAAVNLYERLGFKKIRDDGTYLEMNWVS